MTSEFYDSWQLECCGTQRMYRQTRKTGRGQLQIKMFYVEHFRQGGKFYGIQERFGLESLF